MNHFKRFLRDFEIARYKISSNLQNWKESSLRELSYLSIYSIQVCVNKSNFNIYCLFQDNPSSISVYLPKGRWYNFYDKTLLKSHGEYFEIGTDRDTIPLFIRGGVILPMQSPASTTGEVRKSDLKLLVALNEDGEAVGDLYWDDGLSLGKQRIHIKVVSNCTVFFVNI